MGRSVGAAIFASFFIACFVYAALTHYNECFCCFIYNSAEHCAFSVMAIISMTALVATEATDATRPSHVRRFILAGLTALFLICTFVIKGIGGNADAHTFCLYAGLACFLGLIGSLCPLPLTWTVLLGTVAMVAFRLLFLDKHVQRLNAHVDDERDSPHAVGPSIWQCGRILHKEYLKQWWYLVLVILLLLAYCVGDDPRWARLGSILGLVWTAAGLGVIYGVAKWPEAFPHSRSWRGCCQ